MIACSREDSLVVADQGCGQGASKLVCPALVNRFPKSRTAMTCTSSSGSSTKSPSEKEIWPRTVMSDCHEIEKSLESTPSSLRQRE